MTQITFKTRIVSVNSVEAFDVMCFRTDNYDSSSSITEEEAHESFLISFNLDTRAFSISDHSATFEDTYDTYAAEVLLAFMIEYQNLDAVPETFSFEPI